MTATKVTAARNTEPVAITWVRAIMEASVYEKGARAGMPGLHYRRDLAPGAAELSETPGGQPFITYVCPCGCGCVGVLALCPFPGQTGWDWEAADDMRVAPSLSPSIRRRFGCGWHGWLKKGVWAPADDWKAAQGAAR